MKKNENSDGINYSSGEIDRSISVLENLAKDTERLVNLPKEQRIALLKVAGELSRPHRAEIRKRNKTVKNSRRPFMPWFPENAGGRFDDVLQVNHTQPCLCRIWHGIDTIR